MNFWFITYRTYPKASSALYCYFSWEQSYNIWLLCSRECDYKCPSVSKTPQQLEIIILHHSSFLHFATFKLFSLLINDDHNEHRWRCFHWLTSDAREDQGLRNLRLATRCCLLHDFSLLDRENYITFLITMHFTFLSNIFS